ncbi:MAG: aspartate dehydrogenase [Candidatus Hadarchaeales archaeon]
MRVALLGCGAIGSEVARGIDEGKAGAVELLWVYDKTPEKALKLSASLRSRPRPAESVDQILQDRWVELVVETASQEAVREFSLKVLEAGKDLLILSTGALTEPNLLQRIMEACSRLGRRVYVPSGAILGLDALKAHQLAGVEEVELTTVKFGEKQGVLFEGGVQEAVRLFPRSINVAGTLALVVGADKLRVRVVADPSAKQTVHEVKVKGKLGSFHCRIENFPFEQNPLSSKLAAYSVLATLKELNQNLRVGS